MKVKNTVRFLFYGGLTGLIVGAFVVAQEIEKIEKIGLDVPFYLARNTIFGCLCGYCIATILNQRKKPSGWALTAVGMVVLLFVVWVLLMCPPAVEIGD